MIRGAETMEHLVTKSFVAQVQAEYSRLVGRGLETRDAFAQISRHLCSNKRLLAELLHQDEDFRLA